MNFGGVDQVKEECRDAWGVRMIGDFLQDIRYGFRVLAQIAGIYRDCTAYAGFGHRREHGNIFGSLWRPASPAAIYNASRLDRAEGDDAKSGHGQRFISELSGLASAEPRVLGQWRQ